MPVIASGARVQLAYIPEVNHGETPTTPTLAALRATTRNVNLERELLESAEVRQSRQRSDVRHGFNQVVGTVGFEHSLIAYDDFIAYALASTWVAVTTGTTTLDATAPSTFSRAAGSFVTDGFRPGDYITSAGFTNAANNGSFLIVTVAALTITVTAATLVTEVGGGDESIVLTGKRCSMAQTLTTVSLERQFLDVLKYQLFKGVAVNQWQESVTPRAIVGGSFTLLGMSSDGFSVTSASASPATAAATHSPFAAFDGAIYSEATPIAVATALNFTLDNQRVLEGVIGSRFSPDVFEGIGQVNGDLSAFFLDTDFQDAFFNEEEVTIWLRLNDPNGTDFFSFVWPRVKYTGANIDPPQNGPVVQALPFTALEHQDYATSMWVQRSNV